MKLRMFDFEEFVDELKRRDVKDPVGVCLERKHVSADWEYVGVVASAFDLKNNVVIEYEHFKKLYLVYEIDFKKISEVAKELKERLEEKGFRVVNGVWSV